MAKKIAEDFVHVPALGYQAPNDSAKSKHENNHEAFLLSGELAIEEVLIRAKLFAFLDIIVESGGRFGVFLNLEGIHYNPCDGNRREHGKGNSTQPKLGVALDTEDALGNQDVNGLTVDAMYPIRAPTNTVMNAVIESKPMAIMIGIRIAKNGSVSSAIPKVLPPKAKSTIRIGMMRTSLLLNFFTTRATPLVMAPVA